MEIIWGITLLFPQEYPEEPQRFHNLKPCVIMSYTFAHTNIVWSNEEAEQGLWANVMLWSDPCPDVSSPGFHPAALSHSPSLQTGETTMFFSNLPQHSPPYLSTQPLLSQVLQLCMEVALWLATVGPLTGQLKGDSKQSWQSSHLISPKLWLCSSACTGSLPRSDARWPRADLQPHSSPSSAEWQLLGPPFLPYQPSLPVASKLIKRLSILLQVTPRLQGNPYW